jgi:hypothetical protein
MRRRINPAPQPDDSMYRALVDHKEATLKVILAKIPDTSTFAQLAELVGYSREWVRQRLISAPEKLYRIGRRYQVPKGTAEEFISSIFV